MTFQAWLQECSGCSITTAWREPLVVNCLAPLILSTSHRLCLLQTHCIILNLTEGMRVAWIGEFTLSDHFKKEGNHLGRAVRERLVNSTRLKRVSWGWGREVKSSLLKFQKIARVPSLFCDDSFTFIYPWKLTLLEPDWWHWLTNRNICHDSLTTSVIWIFISQQKPNWETDAMQLMTPPPPPPQPP